jgi:hypothetical protein
MKNSSLLLLIGLAFAISALHSCDSHKNSFYRQNYSWSGKSSAPAYGGSSGNSNSGAYIQNNIPTNSIIPYSYLNEGTPESTKSAAMSGVLTGGETNDLGKWELWNDMVKTALDEQIKLWKIHPYHRYAVLLQTEDGMPIHGAKVSLINKQKAKIWEAVTDNTGAAQLWKGIYQNSLDTSVMEIQISYKGKTDVISNPIEFQRGINTKKLSVTYEKSNDVDIAFVVDATGSMGDEIDFLKEELNDIIKKTQSKYDKINLKLGSVFYRCKGNSYTTRMITLTNEFSAVMDFIKEQSADEGGTESVEIALDDAINKLKWRENARTRLMFLVLDEPSGYSDDVIKKLQEQIQLAAKKGIKIIPIVASGSGNAEIHDRNLEFLMRSSALATNGNYIFMTDHSGVGGKHTEPIIDNYEVELLNDIIARTIENNIYMPEKVKPEDTKVEPDTLLVNNSKDVVDEYLNELDEKSNDSTLLATILPYTDFTTIEELNKNRPVKEMDTTTLLADLKIEAHTLKIYPNPSNGMIKAEYNTEVEYLYLADLSGKILNRINTNGNSSITVDLNEYPNGIYIIQYPDEDRWISAKIVLQK